MYQVFLITDGCNILVALTVYRFESSSITMNHVYLSGAASTFFVLSCLSRLKGSWWDFVYTRLQYLSKSFICYLSGLHNMTNVVNK